MRARAFSARERHREVVSALAHARLVVHVFDVVDAVEHDKARERYHAIVSALARMACFVECFFGGGMAAWRHSVQRHKAHKRQRRVVSAPRINRAMAAHRRDRISPPWSVRS